MLPQIPLTLTNAIIVTAAVSRRLFPKELHPVNERNLASKPAGTPGEISSKPTVRPGDPTA